MTSKYRLSDQLFTSIHQKLDCDQFSGVVLIQQGQHPLFQKAVGFANRPWQIPNLMNTRFRLASISKMFTAIAILQLIEQGHCTLDTPVPMSLGIQSASIPDEVSVYHLLTMTAGIADWFEESGEAENQWIEFCHRYPIYLFRQHPDYLPLFIDQPMVNPPGQVHQYNNASYILLGCLIERITGIRYFDYIQRHIFEPAQMHHSGFVAIDDAQEAIAEGYIPITKSDAFRFRETQASDAEEIIEWRRNIYSITPEAAADGGAVSTAQDLQRFSLALRTGKLLSPQGTQDFLTPKVLEDDENYRGYLWKYGFGNFFLLDDHQHLIRWGHTGEEEGVSCRFYHYSHLETDVVILSNQSESTSALGWDIHDLIMGHA
ncbi:MAG: serine hydrolase domain-containing protein [Elainellaceae cyanobacterium]